MKLKPVTIDDVRNAEDRGEALRRYHAWLKKQRKEDKRQLKNLDSRIRQFQNKLNGKCRCGRETATKPDGSKYYHCERCNKYKRKRNR